MAIGEKRNMENNDELMKSLRAQRLLCKGICYPLRFDVELSMLSIS